MKIIRDLLAAACVLCSVSEADAGTSGYFQYKDNGSSVTVTGYSGPAGPMVIPSLIEGKPVVEIGVLAFHSQSGITSVTIPDSVVTIGFQAFYYCKNLSSVVIPASVTNFGSGIFLQCDSLRTVSLPAGLVAVPSKMFFGCDALEELTIPAGTKSIGSSAFTYCRNLRKLVLPPGLESIESLAFSYCDGLTDFSIPESVSVIGLGAFTNCDGLTRIRLPKGLKVLERYLFQGCRELVEVEVPDGVEKLEDWCFMSCVKLRRVGLPASLKRVGKSFVFCKSLKSVRFPKALRKLSIQAFEGSGVEKPIFSGSAPVLLDGDVFHNVPKTFQSIYQDGKKGFSWPEWGGFPLRPLGPEIAVSPHSGEEFASRKPRIFMGARNVGFERVKKVTIRNIGTRSLKGLSVRLTHNSVGDFICTVPSEKLLKPDESMTIRVAFIPKAVGYRHAKLRIESNDANENPVVIRLRGLGMN